MATSGILQTSSVYYGTYFKVTWNRTAVSEANNTSTIKWVVSLVTPSASWYSNSIKINSLVINGDTVLSNQTYSNKSHGTFELASGTKTITHNDDGTKTFAMSFSGWLIDEGNLTASGNFTLDQINRGKPSASLAISLDNSANATIAGWGVAVKGFTKVSYTITGTPYAQGYSITAYQFSGNGQTINTAAGTTAALTSSGTLFFTGKVMDNRNVWSDADIKSLSGVYDYNPPKITAASAFRSNSSGTETVSGEYITISCTGAIGENADIGNRNSVGAVSYSVTDNDSGTEVASGQITNGSTATIHATSTGGFDINKAYLVTFTVRDTVNSSVVRTILVPKAIVTLDLKEGGLGIGLGIVSSVDEAVTINPDWDLYAGANLSDYIVEQGTSGGWTYRKWKSGIAELWGTHSKSPSSSTATGNLYYSDLISISVPFNIKNTVITGSAQDRYILSNTSTNSSLAGTISFRLLRGTAIQTTSVDISLEVKGKWK